MKFSKYRAAGVLLASLMLVVAVACQPEPPSNPNTTISSSSTTTSTAAPTTEAPTTTAADTTTTTESPCPTSTTEASTTTTADTTTTTEAPTTTGEDTTTTEAPTTTGEDTTTTEAPTTTTESPCPTSTTTTASTTTTTAGPAVQPDVLFVMLDDESIDTTPFYMPRTFAKLAGPHWYKFSQAVAPSPLCGPVRATLLTGETVDHHGMNCNQPNSVVCPKWGAARNSMIPKALANAGVWVGWYGKRVNWDHECKQFEGAAKGWPNLPGVVDDHVHYVDTKELFNQYSLVENGVVHQYDTATQGPASYGTYKTADLAMTGIQNCVAPCTLYWMPQAPHTPGTPAADYDASKVLPGAADYQPPFNEGCTGAADSSIADKPYLLQTYTTCLPANKWKRTKTAASLQAVDNRMPEMIDAFLAKDPSRPKRIIFTSDQGRVLGNHRVEMKEDAYEMTVRTPLYIYDSDAPGGVVDKLVNIRDIPATLLDWQQATALLPQDGRSLVPLYRGTTSNWYTDTYISHLKTSPDLPYLRPYREVRQDCAVAAVQNRHCLKVVLYPGGTFQIKGGPLLTLPDEYEVYVLDLDPWELTNVNANAYTGYAGVPGWDDSNPEVAAVKASLAVHMAQGK